MRAHATQDRVTQSPRLSAAELLRELDETQEPVTDTAWTMGYLDVMLLLLTLFAALLGINYLRGETLSEPAPLNQVELIATLPPVSKPVPVVEPSVVLAAYQTFSLPPEPEPKARPDAKLAEAETAEAEEDTPPKPNADPEPVPADAENKAAEMSLVSMISLPEPPPLPDFVVPDITDALADSGHPGLDLFADGQRLRVEIGDEILFPLGSAELGERAKAVLKQLVDGLVSRDIDISVEGHSDDLAIATDRFPSNWELSSYRATVVARHLIELGVTPERLTVTGYADTRPRVPNDSAQSRSLNRRVSLVLHPPAVAASPQGLQGEGWRRL